MHVDAKKELDSLSTIGKVSSFKKQLETMDEWPSNKRQRIFFPEIAEPPANILFILFIPINT